MDSELRQTLLPFIEAVYPDHRRLMADNNPKHSSTLAKQFLAANGVNWWKTLAELLDCNPIENIWHELKEYIGRTHNKDQLVQGIK